MLIYLDNAATTPLDAEVREAMLPYLEGAFGNPSSIHAFGRQTRAAIDTARSQVASAIGADPSQLVFTSGGTEADNLALIGIMHAQPVEKKHLITTQIEHHAVLDACKYLERFGYDVTYLPVDKFGRIQVEDVRASIRPDTALISVLHGNNEIGTIQPVEEIGELARQAGILFHIDAVQTFGSEPLDVQKLPIDLMSLSSHKIYGPKGIGALYIRNGIKILPRALGGAQERRKRAGTENILGIVGFGKAAELVKKHHMQRRDHLVQLKNTFIEKLQAESINIVINGHQEKSLPHIANISFPGVETETLLIQLDMEGIAAASGSACTSGTLSVSHVLKAMQLPEEITISAIRFSFGKDNTIEEIKAATTKIGEVVRRLYR
ncbi:cysteine desulfurase [Shimazuella sp. AN120528]|uniref:cysteine desulfurase family protein n=1 Tax=Shimazuella soli TaxID=1892854 RepID=UPI001F0D665C|nr:cysteine desulfurase family protein [Shimazuella soli]MCH5583642.1 cysteine desulfurase [Shimazuella soli]